MTSYPHITLTQREEEVARLVMKGYSAKEIAKGLGSSPRTVEQHIVNMRNRLLARDRTHMVAHLLLRGIIIATTSDL
ncbi:helix-turn-helix transcriptional regulator [uncultured Sphingomonas sp.]|uniref:helix-turn-helix domain-containing protein n=1 Tax=Sphingomonas sp. GV3 TaxID=3040671 RepID=UPI002594A5DB|nr:helix-turn-helix transcriptional regulator [uncultured Sphingomonas sp.]